MILKTVYKDVGNSYNAKRDEIQHEFDRWFSDEFEYNGFAITLQ